MPQDSHTASEQDAIYQALLQMKNRVPSNHDRHHITDMALSIAGSGERTKEVVTMIETMTNQAIQEASGCIRKRVEDVMGDEEAIYHAYPELTPENQDRVFKFYAVLKQRRNDRPRSGLGKRPLNDGYEAGVNVYDPPIEDVELSERPGASEIVDEQYWTGVRPGGYGRRIPKDRKPRGCVSSRGGNSQS